MILVSSPLGASTNWLGARGARDAPFLDLSVFQRDASTAWCACIGAGGDFEAAISSALWAAVCTLRHDRRAEAWLVSATRPAVAGGKTKKRSALVSRSAFGQTSCRLP